MIKRGTIKWCARYGAAYKVAVGDLSPDYAMPYYYCTTINTEDIGHLLSSYCWIAAESDLYDTEEEAAKAAQEDEEKARKAKKEDDTKYLREIIEKCLHDEDFWSRLSTIIEEMK